MPWPWTPRPISSWKKLWVSSRHSTWAQMGQLCVAGSPSEPAQQQQKRRAQGEGTRNQGGGLGTKTLLCSPDTEATAPPRDLASPCPLAQWQNKLSPPFPHCVCCGCSLFVFGHPLGTGESTESPDSQSFVYFNTSDYSSSNLRLECGFYYLLLFSVLFKMFPAQAQEELPCAQAHAHAAELTGTKHFPNVLVSTRHVETALLSSATLIFPQRKDVCYGDDLCLHNQSLKQSIYFLSSSVSPGGYNHVPESAVQ